MSKPLYNIDLNKFPSIPTVRPLWGFVPLDEFPALKPFPDLAERIYGCMYFIRIPNDGNIVNVLNEKCNLRAALSDFVSINDMLIQSNHTGLISITFDTLDYPLIHFFKLLRDTNIHLESIKHYPSPRTYNFGNISTGETFKNEDGSDYVDTWNNFTIENCRIDTLKGRMAKRYSISDLKAITEWVNVNQHAFGLQYLLELALKQYCQEIVAVLK